MSAIAFTELVAASIFGAASSPPTLLPGPGLDPIAQLLQQKTLASGHPSDAVSTLQHPKVPVAGYLSSPTLAPIVAALQVAQKAGQTIACTSRLQGRFDPVAGNVVIEHVRSVPRSLEALVSAALSCLPGMQQALRARVTDAADSWGDPLAWGDPLTSARDTLGGPRALSLDPSGLPLQMLCNVRVLNPVPSAFSRNNMGLDRW